MARAEFDPAGVGAAILADPLLVDCYRAQREGGQGVGIESFVAWFAKVGLERELSDGKPFLLWDAKKQTFCPSPRLEAYRARRRTSDAEPVVPGDGWDKAFAELMIDVVKERVRKAERCPAAGR